MNPNLFKKKGGGLSKRWRVNIRLYIFSLLPNEVNKSNAMFGSLEGEESKGE